MFSQKHGYVLALRALILFSACSVCGQATAEILWTIGSGDPEPTISDVNSQSGLIVNGHVRYSDFQVISNTFEVFGDPQSSATAPEAAGITLLPIISGEGDYGLRFMGNWSAAYDATLDTSIFFKVSTYGDWQGATHFTENTLKVSGADVTVVINDPGNPDPKSGLVNVTETVHDGHPDEPIATEIASKSIFETSETEILVDRQPFAYPVEEFWVAKNIGMSGGDGMAHMSVFTQTFHAEPVPEPGTALLVLIAGVIGLATTRRRRRP